MMSWWGDGEVGRLGDWRLEIGGLGDWEIGDTDYGIQIGDGRFLSHSCYNKAKWHT